MGVDTNIYTIFGVKIDWDDDFNDTYDEAYDDPDTPWVLLDGMMGKYIILGKLLFDSGNIRWGLEDGDVYKEIAPDDLANMEQSYREAFNKKFPQFKDLIVDRPFKLLCITHYS